MRNRRCFLELKAKVQQLETNAPKELTEHIRTLKHLIDTTERTMQNEIGDLEHEVNRLRRFSILR